ncbi:MAG: FkbM family methyltransferase [Bacteroidales bacterium]
MNILKSYVLKLISNLGYNIVKKGNAVDNLIDIRIGNNKLYYPENHDFPLNFVTFKEYQRNFLRIVEFLSKQVKDFLVIDVGANIGDTALLIKSVSDCPILCIEGEHFFLPYLTRNTQAYHDIVIHNAFLSEINDERHQVHKVYHTGTMRMKNTYGNDFINTQTLDSVLNKYPEYSNSFLLKIDTDGWDDTVIKGASKLLEKAKPVIFFEFDREFMDNNKARALNLFNNLRNYNYNKLFFYDNYGRFLLSSDISNQELILELYRYINKDLCRFQFFDICVFHIDYEELAIKFHDLEMRIE